MHCGCAACLLCWVTNVTSSFERPQPLALCCTVLSPAAAARGKAIRDFQTEPPTKVVLLTHRWEGVQAAAPGWFRCITRSLPACLPRSVLQMAPCSASMTPLPAVPACPCRAGGAGITLTAGTHIILCEPTLNPSFERQAIGRSHRMGQDKPLTVTRLRMKGG
jgi:hypothetical protein